MALDKVKPLKFKSIRNGMMGANCYVHGKESMLRDGPDCEGVGSIGCVECARLIRPRSKKT